VRGAGCRDLSPSSLTAPLATCTPHLAPFMKFYKYALSLVAYALLGIFILAMAYFWLGDKTPDVSWYYFPAGAAILLLCSFILAKLKLEWELDVVLQVAIVLGPVIWYVNQRETYKRPVYIFVINPLYTGDLDIVFNLDKNAETNAHKIADTLYFKFDEQGKIVLNEDAEYIRESMQKRLVILHPDGKKEIVPFVNKDSFPPDTLHKIVMEDTIIAEKGRMKEMRYRVNYPQRIK
jgi:hypothetical protein